MQKRNIAVTLLFALFLYGFFFAFLLSPTRASSETENRTLAQRPEFSMQALFSGSYTDAVDTFLSDQFPLRDWWITIQAGTQYAIGMREFNGVYLCGDRLIAKMDPPDEKKLEQDISYLNALTEKTNLPVYLAMIPSAAEIWRDRLPAGAGSYDQAGFWQNIQAHTNAIPVDVFGALSVHASEELYYHTDHHWTSLGAYYGYTALAEAMDFQPIPLSAYQKRVETTEFRGTLYSSSGVRWLKPDTIETYVSDQGITVQSNFTGTLEPGQLYDRSKLAVKDKYAMFLGGNQPLCILENPTATGGTLLVVRDSYFDSEVPFLTQHFSKIVLVDLRYNRASVSDLAESYGADAILISYSIPNFCSDNNLIFIGR